MTTPGATLVLLALGTPAKVGARLDQAAAPLARALGLELAPPLDPADPQTSLAVLAAAPAQGARLVPLPRDPGQGLPAGGHWAEALGAWRQPVLVLFSAKQLDTGLPAATQALLDRWQVPCAGLLQWGGGWDGEQRRRDGLPWLGWLPQAGAEPTDVPEPVRLRQALALRLGWLADR
ncbi:hypothetical protein [Cyanobium sp. CH-040]|uniref:hypothetical protein n=1 Tax=Cyanobium sp. CH-040 TaxID=2823708 RepID=UPI0020CB939E|nr:hypothetical protein [Cyanobium sp. CH-040]MCP9926562.1 hypothetical protein [Cyanobium sp. CH-040]